MFAGFVSCTSERKIFRYNYVLNDSPYRNLVFNIKSDSSFLMRNALEGGLGFSLIGTWSRIDGQRLLLTNANGVVSNRDQLAPPKGGRIDVSKAYVDKNYIFPMIHTDTLVFDKRNRSFELKGFSFHIGHYAKD